MAYSGFYEFEFTVLVKGYDRNKSEEVSNYNNYIKNDQFCKNSTLRTIS